MTLRTDQDTASEEQQWRTCVVEDLKMLSRARQRADSAIILALVSVLVNFILLWRLHAGA